MKNVAVCLTIYEACGCCSNEERYKILVNDENNEMEISAAIETVSNHDIDSVVKCNGWFLYNTENFDACYNAVADYTENNND